MARREACESGRTPLSSPASYRGLRVSGRCLLLLACIPVFIYLMLPTLIIVPMALTKGQIIQFPPIWISVHAFADYFKDSQWIDSTIISFKVSILAVCIACVAGSSAAIALHGKTFFGKGAVVGIILTPMVIPLVVLGLGDYLFFTYVQLGERWLEIGLAYSVLVTPYVFITVQAALAGLNPLLARSARSLGAGSASVLYHVHWPTIRPGIAAGAIFAFAVCFDEVVIALFLQSPDATTLPVRMFTSIQYELTPKIAAVASLLLSLASLALLAQAFLPRQRLSPR